MPQVRIATTLVPEYRRRTRWFAGLAVDSLSWRRRRFEFDDEPDEAPPRRVPGTIWSTQKAPPVAGTVVFPHRPPQEPFDPEPEGDSPYRSGFRWSFQHPAPIPGTVVFQHRAPEHEEIEPDLPPLGKGRLWSPQQPPTPVPTSGGIGGGLGFIRHHHQENPKHGDLVNRRNSARLADPSLWVSGAGVYVNSQGKLDLQVANTAFLVTSSGLDFGLAPPMTVLANLGGIAAKPSFQTITTLPRQSRVSSTLYAKVGAVGNASNTVTNLMGYTVAGGLINAANGDTLFIDALFTTASNINGKTFKLLVGTQTVLTVVGVPSGDSLFIRCRIYGGTGTTSVIWADSITSGTGGVSGQSTIGTADLGQDLLLQFTGQGVATNDLTQRAMYVGWGPNE